MGKSVKEGIMPKEFIVNRWFGQSARTHDESCMTEDHDFDTCPGKPGQIDDSAVKVGWNKDDHVELAVVELEDGHFVEHGWEVEGVDQSGPRYIQMDRSGLNRLIKTLRKARDDAFGRDE